MNNRVSGNIIFQFVVICFLSAGFLPYANADVISAYDVVRSDERAARLSDLERMLTREDVAAELQQFGVSADVVMSRVRNLTDDELIALQGSIENQVAGGDALGVIGLVFLVLLVLEVVGATDFFKGI